MGSPFPTLISRSLMNSLAVDSLHEVLESDDLCLEPSSSYIRVTSDLDQVTSSLTSPSTQGRALKVARTYSLTAYTGSVGTLIILHSPMRSLLVPDLTHASKNPKKSYYSPSAEMRRLRL